MGVFVIQPSLRPVKASGSGFALGRTFEMSTIQGWPHFRGSDSCMLVILWCLRCIPDRGECIVYTFVYRSIMSVWIALMSST